MTKLDFQEGDTVTLKRPLSVGGRAPGVSRDVVCVYIPGTEQALVVTSRDLEMVKRAVLTRAAWTGNRPRVGDVITPRQLKDTQWKRGSMFRSVSADRDDWFLVVRGDGKLETVGSEYPEVFGFEDYLNDIPTLRHDAQVWEVVFLP